MQSVKTNKDKHKTYLGGFLLVLMCSVLLVLFDGLSAPWQNELDQQIIIKLRLPLVITACLVGAALSISSASLQVLLHNPLA
ncbi:MAG: iron chelate uptake ABC transporter family permease subunit, partial [Paraglaciecola sp.]|nr:iron chelate uptake ABC transporter family permease subunit [Paraglaciecola sp.]